MRDGFEIKTLGELSIGNKGEYGIGAPSVDYAPNLYKYLRITDISDSGTIDTNSMVCVSDSNAEKYLLQPNDMVFARTGASTGRSYFYNGDEGPLVYAGFLIKFSLDPKQVNPKFIKYYTMSSEYKGWIQSFNAGSTRGNINAKTYADMTICLPSRKTQDLLVETLSCLDDKIANNTKINHHLEQMAQAAFEQILIEECADEPVGVLSDIADINPHRHLGRGQDAIYIEMANLPTRSSFPVDWGVRPFSGGMKFTNGDTIMARITPCLENGKTAYINFLEEGTVAFGSTEYIVITSKPGYCSEMFYYLARHPDFVSYAVRNMNGSSGRQRVSGDTIGRYELHIPSSENVRKFAIVALPIMESIRQNALESRSLAALRDTLLPRLMSGELDVSNIKI